MFGLFFWSRSQCCSALPPTPCLSLLSLWKRSKVAVTSAIRDFMFLLTVKRRQGYTHIHMTSTHMHTRSHPSSSAVLCSDRRRAKVHSATGLTTSLSLLLSFPLPLCLLLTFFREKCQLAISILLPSLRLFLQGPSPFAFFSLFYLAFREMLQACPSLFFSLCFWVSHKLFVHPCVRAQKWPLPIHQLQLSLLSFLHPFIFHAYFILISLIFCVTHAFVWRLS